MGIIKPWISFNIPVELRTKYEPKIQGVSTTFFDDEAGHWVKVLPAECVPIYSESGEIVDFFGLGTPAFTVKSQRLSFNLTISDGLYRTYQLFDELKEIQRTSIYRPPYKCMSKVKIRENCFPRWRGADFDSLVSERDVVVMTPEPKGPAKQAGRMICNEEGEVSSVPTSPSMVYFDPWSLTILEVSKEKHG